MKNFNVLLFAATAAFMISCGTSETTQDETSTEPVSYTLDTDASSLEWTGRKSQGDDKHSGTIDFSEGSVETLGGNLTSGNFKVNMATLSTTDNMPTGKQEMLNGHLKSDEFFDVEKYSTADVKIGELKDGKLPTTITLMGMEFTKNLPVEVKITDDKVTIKGDFDFDFSGISTKGFSADPETGTKILTNFSFKLNVVLKK